MIQGTSGAVHMARAFVELREANDTIRPPNTIDTDTTVRIDTRPR